MTRNIEIPMGLLGSGEKVVIHHPDWFHCVFRAKSDGSPIYRALYNAPDSSVVYSHVSQTGAFHPADDSYCDIEPLKSFWLIDRMLTQRVPVRSPFHGVVLMEQESVRQSWIDLPHQSSMRPATESVKKVLASLRPYLCQNESGHVVLRGAQL